MKNILELKIYCFCRYFYYVLLPMGAIDQLPPPSLESGPIIKWTSPCIVRSFSRIKAPCTSSTMGGILIAPTRILQPQNFHYVRKKAKIPKNHTIIYKHLDARGEDKGV
jgi:hypothetical protein